jgi:hypothetical protein
MLKRQVIKSTYPFVPLSHFMVQGKKLVSKLDRKDLDCEGRILSWMGSSVYR